VPNGIPVRQGNAAGPTEEFGIAEDEVVILAVGNLVERKGHIVLLKALAELEREGLAVPWRVIIAGRGEQRSALEGFAAEAGFADRVHLPGHRDDIPDLHEAAHIVCMPSLWEGLPLAVLEGMHASNCVVASRTSGIPEAIEDGEHGLLVEPGDVGGLASALRRVLENAEFRKSLGQAAGRRARAEFSVAGMTDRYLELYRCARP
jgi:glycosyltransferase involved in cell wall biosynthesis